MPPRNAPLPNAVNLFNCNICDKGYPRQTDYENHLRSYDHNHRQRLQDMKKLTAQNEIEKPSKGPVDMRSIPMGDANKSAGLGSRFKKIGAAGGVAGGNRFKKVGVAVGGTTTGATELVKTAGASAVVKPATIDLQKEAQMNKADSTPTAAVAQESVADVVAEKQEDAKNDEDVIMVEADEDELIVWEEYDFTKPTGCDHANCPGCKPTMGGTYEDGWLVVGAT